MLERLFICDSVYCMQAEHDGAMPPYFRFLTIMAFHVFLQEQVTSLCVHKVLLVLIYFQFPFTRPVPVIRRVRSGFSNEKIKPGNS